MRNVEHILLSVTVVSDDTSAGQFDDSCAYLVRKGLKDYAGVITVRAEVQYDHTKIEGHTDDCVCGKCTFVPYE